MARLPACQLPGELALFETPCLWNLISIGPLADVVMEATSAGGLLTVAGALWEAPRMRYERALPG